MAVIKLDVIVFNMVLIDPNFEAISPIDLFSKKSTGKSSIFETILACHFRLILNFMKILRFSLAKSNITWNAKIKTKLNANIDSELSFWVGIIWSIIHCNNCGFSKITSSRLNEIKKICTKTDLIPIISLKKLLKWTSSN